MKTINKSIKILLGMFLFFVTTIVLSQEILQPVLEVPIACGDSPTKSFKVSFATTGVFPSDNEFTIELSDGNGIWDAPINLGTITTANSLLNFDSTFILPDDTFGSNYKIRLVASSPVKTSLDSEPFKAYKMFTGFLVLNDFKHVFLCDGDSADLTLNTTEKGEYEWYRNGVLFTTTIDPVLSVSKGGTYQVKIDYSGCSFVNSTTVDVNILSEEDKQIKGASVIQICGEELHTFEANVVNTSYTYNWYLNTVLVHSSNTSTYTTPSTGQLGSYYLEIDTGTCLTNSNEVELTQESTPTLTITDETPLFYPLLPGEAVDLSVTVTGSTTYTVQWYKDGNKLFGINETTLNVNQSGDYVIDIIESAVDGCAVIQPSKTMSLLAIKSFEPIIVTSDTYESCNATSVDLRVQKVNVITEDDNVYVLTTEQLNMLSYQWTFNDVPISDATNNELTLSSYTENGFYKMEISIGAFKDVYSNELDIKLTEEEPLITSLPSSNSLCPGGSIIYTISDLVAGYTYEWFKDADTVPVATNVTDFEVLEVGTYLLKMTGFGCEKIIETIDVVLFDASAIVVTPSEKVVLVEGEIETITASGAESYLWYEGESASGMPLATSETLDVSEIGFYTVVATVGSCGVEKVIEVIEQDDQVVVPNVVTPNGDAINDTWKISNKYAFQPTVVIELYNSNGKEILKTSNYQNDWPLESLGSQRVFYYKIIKEEVLIKAGTISVLD
ncbi:gliding motility-associated C-terminal domain-containing protein [Tenacibaculum pacificus]|uniref:T9SS type B sorting domain-containing protein n=1 Tax=Tenacibaculum pacificus TaxID=3018314 RepID=UPI0022F3F24F|nr:gliding motility-associated C-terminal domain-containing protein [Tenacibaculum pacificus]WBX72613.1 gliding motility-associated C-terminal domain-containing protein [Tenacibaculum pacificus]